MRVHEAIDGLLAGYRPGHSLPQAFYDDPAVYRLELARIWRESWLFAAHSCELAGPGDAVVFDVDRDSILLVRGGDGALRAFHNVCRHRGSRLRDEDGTGLRRIVCPYHQWSYGLDGQLIGCGGMDRDEGLDRDEYGLVEVAVAELSGLVFVFLGDQPTPIAEMRQAFAAVVAPQGLERAKVAATREYDVAADWKLVWENNRECWHCHVGHPEYTRANFDTADPADERVRARISERAAAVEATLTAHGLALDHAEAGLYRFPSADRWWAANRTPLADGWVTESVDGGRVAPLMGAYENENVGTLRMRAVPNFWNHSSADHAVSTRLAPAGQGRTRIRVQWLVDADAVEGRDYRLEELMPFWQLTSEQDWELCERNQRGVLSSGYRPGPYSEKREYNVKAFVDWYLKRLGL